MWGKLGHFLSRSLLLLHQVITWLHLGHYLRARGKASRRQHARAIRRHRLLLQTDSWMHGGENRPWSFRGHYLPAKDEGANKQRNLVFLWEDGPASKCWGRVFTPVQRGHNLLPTSKGGNMQSQLTTIQLALCIEGTRNASSCLDEGRSLNGKRRKE